LDQQLLHIAFARRCFTHASSTLLLKSGFANAYLLFHPGASMPPDPPDFSELLFPLLSLSRENKLGLHLSDRWFLRNKLRAQASPLCGHLAFWLALCRSAGLLDEDYRATIFVPGWLGMRPEQQQRVLFRAWINLIADPAARRRRGKLVEWILNGRSIGDLKTSAAKRELPGLMRLLAGHWAEQAVPVENEVQTLHADDRAAASIYNQTLPNSGQGFLNWSLDGAELRVPYPLNWRLTWDLEYFLDPDVSDLNRHQFEYRRYPLSPVQLRHASQRGDPSVLIDLLEQGIGKPLPAELSAHIRGQPVLRLSPVLLLEFSDPNELAELRKVRRLRGLLEHLISPRHVLLDRAAAPDLLRRLHRRGVVVQGAEEYLAAQSGSKAQVTFSAGERATLLAAVEAIHRLGLALDLPQNLVQKLSGSLAPDLLAAAVHRAEAAVPKMDEQEQLPSEQEKVPDPESSMLAELHSAIQRQETVAVVYQVPGRSVERRLLSPLLVEQRSGKWYLVAYCHNRRGNRTFRLDRLRLVDE
jgi:hypothetical protein